MNKNDVVLAYRATGIYIMIMDDARERVEKYTFVSENIYISFFFLSGILTFCFHFCT